MKNVSTISYGLHGYGLLRAFASCPSPTQEVGAAMAKIVRRLPAASPDQYLGIVTLLEKSKSVDNMRIGLRGVAGIFADRYDLREQLIGEVKSNPLLSEKINAWNDIRWMRMVDFIMGVGESLPDTDPGYFDIVRSNMRTWSHNPDINRDRISETIADIFRKPLSAITEKTVLDESEWKNALPLLWLYWASVPFAIAHKHLNLKTQILNIVTNMRALRRLQSSDIEENDIKRIKGEVEHIMYEQNGNPRLGINKPEYVKAWKDINRVTPQQHPLTPVARSEMGTLMDRELEKWITEAIENKDLPKQRKRDRSYIEILREARRAAIECECIDEFLNIITSPMRLSPDRYNAVKKIAGRYTAPVSEKPTQLFTPTIERHRVIWNPYAVDDDVLIHEGYGEGRTVGEPEANGLIPFYMSGENIQVKVLQRTLISATDRPAFIEVLKQRADKLSYIPPLFAALTLRKHLSKNDPIMDIVKGMSMQCDEVPYIAKTGDIFAMITGYTHKPKNIIEMQSEQVMELMLGIGRMLGIDPITWSFRLASGVAPDKIILSTRTKLKEPTKKALRRRITPDLIRSFVWFRPWNRAWSKAVKVDTLNMLTAGYYYPNYYSGKRTMDLNGLYFGYRDGHPDAVAQTVSLLAPLVKKWAEDTSRKGEVILVPMIGTAPNEQLADHFEHPTIFPWLPRPDNYGKGVEGKTVHQKMEMVSNALKLDPSESSAIKGRSVLIIDDNITDAATYVVARRLLYDAGAAEVGIIALTETIRREEDHDWVLR